MNGSLELTDAALLAQVQAGDRVSLLVLLDRYEMPIFHYLHGVLRDRHAAEDVLQDTFIVALLKAESACAVTVRGWLFTVAHQQALLWKRKQKRVPTTAASDAFSALPAVVEEPLAPVIQHELANQLQDWLNKLPACQQAVIRLRVYDGLKFREVAERLGCPLNTALARMRDGLQQLRRISEEQDD